MTKSIMLLILAEFLHFHACHRGVGHGMAVDRDHIHRCRLFTSARAAKHGWEYVL